MTLSRETIKLMMQCQRMVNKEFGVRVNLDNEQAIAIFLAYASQSGSVELKDCSDKLMIQVIPVENKVADKALDKPKVHVRYYRGQPVVDADVKPVIDNKTEKDHTKEITYRGQKVCC